MSGGKNGGNSPGRPRTLSARDVYMAFEDVPGPATTAAEFARVLDTSSQTTNRRLDELENDGRVAWKKVGATAIIWWRTSDYP